MGSGEKIKIIISTDLIQSGPLDWMAFHLPNAFLFKDKFHVKRQLIFNLWERERILWVKEKISEARFPRNYATFITQHESHDRVGHEILGAEAQILRYLVCTAVGTNPKVISAESRHTNLRPYSPVRLYTFRGTIFKVVGCMNLKEAPCHCFQTLLMVGMR